MVCLLAEGHALLEGVPGLAKTLAAETLARVVGGSFARIQFTPDLLPADLMGTRIYRASSESFDVELGPVFVNFVLADEINRAPAKVQSALLEVMAEHQVSIGGQTFDVPTPFLVLATQNPIESEGVYPLPEAQRDRFLMKIVVGYPTAGEEVEIVQRMGVNPPEADEVLSASTSWRPAAAPCRRRLRRPSGRRLRGHGRAGHSLPAELHVVRDRSATHLRGQPPGQPRPHRGGAGPRPDAGPQLPAPPGRVRHRPRRAPPPPGALLRGLGPGHECRPDPGPGAVHGAGPPHRPVASADRAVGAPASADRVHGVTGPDPRRRRRRRAAPPAAGNDPDPSYPAPPNASAPGPYPAPYPSAESPIGQPGDAGERSA